MITTIAFQEREREALKMTTDLTQKAVEEISDALRQLLADVFAL
jgi:hypothetical protein